MRVLADALDYFKVALKFPIGHGILKLSPFPFAGGNKVFDKCVAEKFACKLRLFKHRRGLF